MSHSPLSSSASAACRPRKRGFSVEERKQNRQSIHQHLQMWHQQRSRSIGSSPIADSSSVETSSTHVAGFTRDDSHTKPAPEYSTAAPFSSVQKLSAPPAQTVPGLTTLPLLPPKGDEEGSQNSSNCAGQSILQNHGEITLHKLQAESSALEPSTTHECSPENGTIARSPEDANGDIWELRQGNPLTDNSGKHSSTATGGEVETVPAEEATSTILNRAILRGRSG